MKLHQEIEYLHVRVVIPDCRLASALVQKLIYKYLLFCAFLCCSSMKEDINKDLNAFDVQGTLHI